MKTSAPGSSRVSRPAFAFDEHVDVASNRWRRIAKAVPHARPARLKSVHHILDRLRLDLHDALGVGKSAFSKAGSRTTAGARIRPPSSSRPRNRRQVARNALPGLALVAACIDRAVARAEIDAGGIERIGCQGLTHHTEICAGLRQPRTTVSPMRPAIARAPDGHACVWRIAALGVTVERQEEQRVGVTGMGDNRKAKARRETVLDAAPGRAAVVAAVHAAMVLLVEAVGTARRERQVMHALAELGITLSLGQKIAARAQLRGLQVSPPSSV